jgi:lysophospholipase L1-like esterase
MKIMPLGDSITEGVVAGGYRLPLYNLLTAAGDSVQFVGSQTINPGSLPADQTHHEGHGGYVIAGYPIPAGGGNRKGITENIGTWLGPTGADPDVILLMIGTNDVYFNPHDHLAATAPDRLSDLISRISSKTTGLKPNAALIVAQVTPDALSDASLTRAYNAGVASVVANHRALGENVSMVNMYSALDPKTDFVDGEHPNAGGCNKMAAVWFDGIRAVAHAPEPGSAALLTTGVLGAFAWSIKKTGCRPLALRFGRDRLGLRPRSGNRIKVHAMPKDTE